MYTDMDCCYRGTYVDLENDSWARQVRQLAICIWGERQMDKKLLVSKMDTDGEKDRSIKEVRQMGTEGEKDWCI